MSTAVISRNLVVQRWGTPNATVGSVNEPREMEEHGHRFNEKWIYRLSAAPTRRADGAAHLLAALRLRGSLSRHTRTVRS